MGEQNEQNTGGQETEHVSYGVILQGLVPPDKEVHRMEIDTLGGELNSGFQIVSKDIRPIRERIGKFFIDTFRPINQIEGIDQDIYATFNLDLTEVRCSDEVSEEEWFTGLVKGIKSTTNKEVVRI